MIEFESKRKFKKRLYSKFTLVVLMIIFIFVAQGTWDIFKKQRMVDKDLNNTQQTLDNFNDRKIELEEKLERVNSDVGKEEMLREKYSVAKEGEKAVFILDSKEEVEVVVEEKGFFRKILDSLFN